MKINFKKPRNKFNLIKNYKFIYNFKIKLYKK